ncbi:MAG: cyclohexanone monooxygenase [Myxococcota bacterium]|jgi:cyclohexanone monooxygenase
MRAHQTRAQPDDYIEEDPLRSGRFFAPSIRPINRIGSLLATQSPAKHADLRIAVIGAGPGGLALGRELLENGFTNITLYEATDAVGGTWHIHTYPGLACDVWAHAYTFSARPNPDWTASFVEQPEIEAYLQQCAKEFGLEPHIRLNARIAKMEYQDDATWTLATEAGDVFEADVIINAMGNQHTPLYPDVPGMDTFAGPSFHGTRWDHDVDLAGKKVVIVGSAASAVQIVPEVAKQAGHLTVMQRSPNWIMPRGRKPYSESQRAWFRRIPLLVRLTQSFQRFLMGFVHQAATLGHKRQSDFEKIGRKAIDDAITDPELRAALTPDSRFGCKRGLVSDDFYPALAKEHVELVAEGLASVGPKGVTTASGREIDADVVIYCTGYRILDYDRIEVIGKDGQSLAGVMEKATEAFKGIATPGFPNYFFAVGPNGLVLNVPYFITVEKNAESIVKRLCEKQAAGARSVEVKSEANREYNDWMREEFPKYAWGNESCNSYYRTADGSVPFLFPGNFKTYAKMHDESGLHDYDCT